MGTWRSSKMKYDPDGNVVGDAVFFANAYPNCNTRRDPVRWPARSLSPGSMSTASRGPVGGDFSKTLGDSGKIGAQLIYTIAADDYQVIGLAGGFRRTVGIPCFTVAQAVSIGKCSIVVAAHPG